MSKVRMAFDIDTEQYDRIIRTKKTFGLKTDAEFLRFVLHSFLLKHDHITLEEKA